MIRIGQLIFIGLTLFVSGSWLLLWMASRFGRQRKLMAQLAGKYRGELKRRLPFAKTVRFLYGTSPVRVRATRRWRDMVPVLDVKIGWPNRRLNFELVSADGVFKPRRGCKLLSSEELGFSRAFHVQTNDPTLVRQMLKDESQWKIVQLADLMSGSPLTIRIRRGNLTVTKPGRLHHFQRLDDFVRMSLELASQLELALTEGIEFVNEGVAQIVANVKCPICSEEVDESMVVCVRCKTPHCHDCWIYNGQCATFACEEKRFIRTGSFS